MMTGKSQFNLALNKLNSVSLRCVTCTAAMKINNAQSEVTM
jgi:hypothetical protein